MKSTTCLLCAVIRHRLFISDSATTNSTHLALVSLNPAGQYPSLGGANIDWRVRPLTCVWWRCLDIIHSNYVENGVTVLSNNPGSSAPGCIKTPMVMQSANTFTFRLHNSWFPRFINTSVGRVLLYYTSHHNDEPWWRNLIDCTSSSGNVCSKFERTNLCSRELASSVKLFPFAVALGW